MKVLPVCILCGDTPPLGLTGGIYINHHLICDCCEQEILQTQTVDVHYRTLVENLKRLWY